MGNELGAEGGEGKIEVEHEDGGGRSGEESSSWKARGKKRGEVV